MPHTSTGATAPQAPIAAQLQDYLLTAPKATSLAADLFTGTWTFAIARDQQVGSGVYVLVPEEIARPRQVDGTAAASPAAAVRATVPATIPAIGQPWPGLEGSVYAGVSRGENGEPDAHLVLLADQPEDSMKWQAALDWAAALGDGAHVPTRFESALLYANVRDSLDTGVWHWTSTQYSSGNAWGQYFNYGGQYGGGKSASGRVRAVRRFNLQSFNPSQAA